MTRSTREGSLGPVLVIVGHPHPDSYCHALAQHYAQGAREAGAKVELVPLHALDFDPNLRAGFDGEQPLEADLVTLRRQVEDAAHVVVVAPLWWGSVPALLKGLFDRLLLPGWAFRMRPSGLPEGLLRGRSARFVLTMDSPGYWYRWVHRRAAHRSVVTATLHFCGLAPVALRTLHRVGQVSDATRRGWFSTLHADGRADVQRLRRRAPHARLPATLAAAKGT